MEIEKISENQIKIVLHKSDLLSHDISISDLTYSRKRMEQLFQELTDQAMTECQFNEENTPLYVEAVPLSQDSIMIIATKDTHKDECMNLPERVRKADQLSLHETTDIRYVNYAVLKKVSESQLKVLLSQSALLNYDISISDLKNGSKKAQRFFQRMIKKAMVEYHFNIENAPLIVKTESIQSDSIVIIITKFEKECDDHLASENVHSRGNNALMKKFSESQIRIYLSQSAMQNQDISMSDISLESEKTQRFLRKMMKQAAVEYQFNTKNTPIMIEAVIVPPNSIVIIVTKLVVVRDDQLTSELEQQEQYKHNNHSIKESFKNLLKRIRR